MTNALRRLRGVVGIALTWGVAWAAIGMALTLIVTAVAPDQIDGDEGPSKVGMVLGFAGFLSGLGFAGLFMLGEKGRTVRDLSLGRAGLWGFLGGAAIPALMGADIGEGVITGTLGAVFAAGTLAWARRGPPLSRADRGHHSQGTSEVH